MPSANFYLNRPFKKGSGKKHKTKILNPCETMIFLYVSYPNRKNIKVSTGEKALAKDWDFQKKCFKSSTAGSLTFNSRLAYLKSEVLQAISRATTENVDITIPQLQHVVEDVMAGKKPRFDKKSFLEYYDDFLTERSTLVQPRTLDKFRSFKNIITEFLELRMIESRDFLFESIDHRFEPDFKNYLIYTRKIVNNTISKYFEVLGVVMKWGIRNKFHTNSAFRDFAVVPRDKTEIIFLEHFEVKAIEALELSGNEDFARTIFLFSLYAGGQRLSDIKRLRHRDIIFNDKSEADWHLYQKKSKKTVKNVLPLLNEAIHYLMKYYSKEKDPTSRVFPSFADQEVNDNINIICKKAGVTQPVHFVKYSGTNIKEITGIKSDFITHKSARKSFVSIAIALGMHPDLIIQYTGHTTTKVMQKHYLGVSQKFKREALFKLFSQETTEKNSEKA